MIRIKSVVICVHDYTQKTNTICFATLKLVFPSFPVTGGSIRFVAKINGKSYWLKKKKGLRQRCHFIVLDKVLSQCHPTHKQWVLGSHRNPKIPNTPKL